MAWFSYDEWGNRVFHIQTGLTGIKMLEEMGIKNTMSKEEYDKHMASYRKLKKEREDAAFKSVFEALNKL